MQRPTRVSPLLPTALRSPRAKLVYLALRTWEPATLDELNDRLGESRLALLGVLSTLEDRSLVRTTNDGYRHVPA